MAAGEVAGGSFVGDGVKGTPSMLLVSGSAWFEVQEAARFFAEAGSHLGGVLVEILQWWGVGLWFQVRELEDSHGQMLPS